MTGEIVHHLAAASRMADVNCILQFEMIGDGLQVVGVVIHVMPAVGLSRAAVPAPILGDDPITFGEEEQHLRVPIVRAQGPPVAEYDRLSAAPVFIIDLYPIFRCHVTHILILLVVGRHLVCFNYRKTNTALRGIGADVNSSFFRLQAEVA